MNSTAHYNKSNNNSILLFGFIASTLVLFLQLFNKVSYLIGFNPYQFKFLSSITNWIWPITTILIYLAIKKIVEVKYNQNNLGLFLSILIGLKIADFAFDFIFYRLGISSFYEIHNLIKRGMWFARNIILIVFGLTLLQSKISFYGMRKPYAILTLIIAALSFVHFIRRIIGAYIFDSSQILSFFTGTSIPSILLSAITVIVLYKAFTDQSFNDTEHSGAPFT